MARERPAPTLRYTDNICFTCAIHGQRLLNYMMSIAIVACQRFAFAVVTRLSPEGKIHQSCETILVVGWCAPPLSHISVSIVKYMYRQPLYMGTCQHADYMCCVVHTLSCFLFTFCVVYILCKYILSSEGFL